MSPETHRSSSSLVVASRFRGPPGRGNGGYVAGRLAATLGADAATVSIRRAVPLERELGIRRGAGVLELVDGDVVLAAATAGADELADPSEPPVVTLAEARDATLRFPRHDDHPLPECFPCGTAREDGLRIFPGPVADRPPVWAAPWTPAPDLGDDEGLVRPEFLWAALDCAGAFAVNEPPRGLALLGRFAARVRGSLAVGEPAIVVAWPIAAEGRKLHPGTAILRESGEVVAHARATWILT